MDGILGTVASGLFGGGVGLLGTVVSRVFGWLEMKEKNKALEINNAHELRLLEEQNKAASMERDHEYALAGMNADTEVRVGSYQHDQSLRPHQWVDSVRAITRPVLTVLSIAAWGVVVYIGAVIYGEQLVYKTALDQANFLAMTAYTWWFGSRDRKQK